MADKKIRDYIPGQNDYLTFAQTMNNNAQIDFQKNKVTAGKVIPEQKPVTSDAGVGAVAGDASMQTRPIGAQAYTEIRGGFKGVLDDSIKGIDTKYTSLCGRTLGDSFSQSVYDGGASGGKTESGETGNATGEVGGAVVSGTGAPVMANGKLSFDDWMSDNGYDPESDYNQAKNDLEYQYMTHLNNYGARAEELYQMGLSGSGVSDIYGVNAYSAYLAASNDLALARIEQENEYRRMYKAYSDEFDAAEQLKAETEKGEVGTIAANLVSQLNYSPEKAQSFRDYYKTQGKSDEWIDSVIESADSLYNLNQITIDVGNVKSQVDAMLSAAGVSYDGSESAKNAIKSYLDQNNMSQHYDEVIATYDTQLKDSEKAAFGDEVNKAIEDLNTITAVTPESIVLSDISDSITAYKVSLHRGDITQEQYDAYVAATSNAVKTAILHALENENTLANAYNVVGMTPEEWNSLKDDDGKVLTGNDLLSAQKAAVMDTLGQQHKAGTINDESFNAVMNDWVTTEITTAIEADKNNAAASGLADFGLAMSQLIEWKNTGYYSDDLFKQYANELVNQSGIEVKKISKNKIQLDWGGTVKGAEATVTINNDWNSLSEKVNPDDLLSSLLDDRQIDSNLFGKTVSFYEGNLYFGIVGTSINGHQNIQWYKADSSCIKVTGEGESQTKNTKEGIYNLLVYMLESQYREKHPDKSTSR